MKNFIETAAGMLNQIAKQCSVRFIATCTFGGTYQVEIAIKPSRGKEVIVDIGNDGQAETASQNVERLRNVRIEVELGKGFEIAPNQRRIAFYAKMSKSLV